MAAGPPRGRDFSVHAESELSGGHVQGLVETVEKPQMTEISTTKVVFSTPLFQKESFSTVSLGVCSASSVLAP